MCGGGGGVGIAISVLDLKHGGMTGDSKVFIKQVCIVLTVLTVITIYGGEI